MTSSRLRQIADTLESLYQAVGVEFPGPGPDDTLVMIAELRAMADQQVEDAK